MRWNLGAASLLIGLTAASAAAQGAVRIVDPPAAGAVHARQFEELTRLARQRLERALLVDADREDVRRPLLLEAERFSRAAAELMPDRADGWFLVAASIGLRSEYESTRVQIRVAGEMLSLATTALDRDPEHAGAHHVLGRLNLEAMSLSGVARMIATHLYGSALLRGASWEQAERHLRRAAALEPDALYHKLWLGRLYLERGEEDDARRVLEEIARAEPLTALDSTWKQEAAEELAALER